MTQEQFDKSRAQRLAVQAHHRCGDDRGRRCHTCNDSLVRETNRNKYLTGEWKKA